MTGLFGVLSFASIHCCCSLFLLLFSTNSLGQQCEEIRDELFFPSIYHCKCFNGCRLHLLMASAPKKMRAEGLANNAARLGFTFKGDISVKPKGKFAPLRLFCIQPPGMMENFQNNTMCFAMKTQKT